MGQYEVSYWPFGEYYAVILGAVLVTTQFLINPLNS